LKQIGITNGCWIFKPRMLNSEVPQYDILKTPAIASRNENTSIRADVAIGNRHPSDFTHRGLFFDAMHPGSGTLTQIKMSYSSGKLCRSSGDRLEEGHARRPPNMQPQSPR